MHDARDKSRILLFQAFSYWQVELRFLSWGVMEESVKNIPANQRQTRHGHERQRNSFTKTSQQAYDSDDWQQLGTIFCLFVGVWSGASCIAINMSNKIFVFLENFIKVIG